MNTGKQGEALFKQIMQSKGYQVQDVSDNPDYWYKDIDFIITSPTSGLTKTFEVKWDSKIGQTGNLYLELTNVHSKCGQGWYKFCEADYVAYGDARAHLFYILPLGQLRERVKQLPQRMAQCGGDSTGLLVNLKDLEDFISVIQED